MEIKDSVAMTLWNRESDNLRQLHSSNVSAIQGAEHTVTKGAWEPCISYFQDHEKAVSGLQHLLFPRTQNAITSRFNFGEQWLNSWNSVADQLDRPELRLREDPKSDGVTIGELRDTLKSDSPAFSSDALLHQLYPDADRILHAASETSRKLMELAQQLVVSPPDYRSMSTKDLARHVDEQLLLARKLLTDRGTAMEESTSYTTGDATSETEGEEKHLLRDRPFESVTRSSFDEQTEYFRPGRHSARQYELDVRDPERLKKRATGEDIRPVTADTMSQGKAAYALAVTLDALRAHEVLKERDPHTASAFDKWLESTISINQGAPSEMRSLQSVIRDYGLIPVPGGTDRTLLGKAF